jgi:hypothetical protein
MGVNHIENAFAPQGSLVSVHLECVLQFFKPRPPRRYQDSYRMSDLHLKEGLKLMADLIKRSVTLTSKRAIGENGVHVGVTPD